MKMKSLNLIAGICLLVVTIIEVFEERTSLELEIEHGLLIYAIAHVLNAFVEFVESIRKIREHRSEAA